MDAEEPPNEIIELEPVPRDIYREWRYPMGEIESGQLVKIAAPDDCHRDLEYKSGFSARDEVNERPVGVVVLLVRGDGKAVWTSHAVTTETTREELVADHAAEMMRQTNALGWLDSPRAEWPASRDTGKTGDGTMRISQVIARLTEIQAACGDLEVRSYPYAGEDWSPAVAPEPLLDDAGKPFVAIDGRG
ncbi:hypothetical protein [Streptomyces smyrnaeus]|uniref:hypothetical protein n=1 Tax=Streptomyces smyrnaeus TaxID=1387713 RepID=UPI0036A27820